MINLLPPNLVEQYTYGRRNTALRRWLIAFAAGLVGVVVIGSLGVVYLKQSTASYQRQISQSQKTLQDQNIEGIKKESEDITNSLKLVVKVLSKEILFSKLLTQVGAVTPSNTALTDLTIAKTTGAIDITAIAADYQAATQLQVNLADPSNKIFSKADIQSITCSTSPSDPRYPCTVTIKALFAENNPFLFINTGGTKR